MKKFSVVISRQFGSLGRPIAKEMSEILGVEYYDRDIVTMEMCIRDRTGCGNTEASAASGSSASSAQRTVEDVREAGVLKVGAKSDTLNIGMIDTSTGEYEGYEIDLAYEIAASIFDCTAAVSYTHLDVYKRQKYMQPQEIAWLNSYHAKVYEKIAPLLTEEEREWLKEATRPVK